MKTNFRVDGKCSSPFNLTTELTFNESELLDSARASISLNGFNGLDGFHSLWNKVVGILNQSFVKPSRCHNGGILVLVSEDTHDYDDDGGGEEH